MYPFARSKSFILLFPSLLVVVVLCGVLWYINSINLVAVRVLAYPTKTEYVVGEQFSTSGMVLQADYSFGITRPVEYFTHNVPARFSSTGTFQYYALFIDRGISKIVPFEVVVHPKVFTALVLDSAPFQTNYVVGQELNRSGLSLRAQFNNRIYEPININSEDLQIIQPSFDAPNSSASVVVRYTFNGTTREVNFPISISSTQMLSLTAVGNLYKNTYVQTEQFDPDGLSIIASYNNGATEQITSYTTNFDVVVQTLGQNRPLTISYSHGSQQFETQVYINVIAKEVTNVQYILPNKQNYFVNDVFDPTGMQVIAFYNDYTSEIIPIGSVLHNFHDVVARADDNKVVQFNYLGFTTAFNINVKNQTLGPENFYFDSGIITGLTPQAYSLEVLTFPKAINGIDIKTIRIPKEANSGLDNGSLILDLSHVTKLKTLLIEKNVPAQLDFELPNSLENIFVGSNNYANNPAYSVKPIRLINNYFSFNASTNTISLIKTATPRVVNLMVPGYWIDGTPVYTVGDFAATSTNQSFIQTIGVAEGITQITSAAFRDNTNSNNTTKTIVLPNSLVSIGSLAFSSLNNLQRINISPNVVSISTDAFNGMRNLREFVVAPENQNFAVLAGFLVSKDLKTLIRYPDRSPFGPIFPDEITAIGNNAFDNSSSLGSIIISNKVESIGQNAFRNSSVTDVSFESGSALNSILGSAFAGASSLVSITLPSLLQTVGVGVFSGCVELNSVVFEGTLLTDIPNSFFANCRSLQSIVLPEGITRINSWAFNGASGLVDVIFPDTIQRIESSAFTGCLSIQTVYLKNIQFIGTNAFNGATSLQNIHIGLMSNFSSIDGVLLNGAGTTVIMYPIGRTNPTYTVPNGVTTIGASSFAKSPYLQQVHTNQVVTIASEAFNGCLQLSDIQMGSALQVIGDLAFSSCPSLSIVIIGDGVSDINPNFVFGSPIESFVAPNNAKYASDAYGVLYEKEAGINKTLFKYPTHKILTVFPIPASVTYIGNSAFEGAGILQQVSAQGLILRVGERAFANAQAITSIFSLSHLEDSANALGKEAFFNMKNLTAINMALAQTRILPDGLFDGCTNLSSVVFPTNTREMGSNIIRGTNITMVNMPSGVNKVAGTFFGANNLVTVNVYPSTPPTYSGTISLFATGKEAPGATLNINVPLASFLAYQYAAGWSVYSSKLRPI